MKLNFRRLDCHCCLLEIVLLNCSVLFDIRSNFIRKKCLLVKPDDQMISVEGLWTRMERDSDSWVETLRGKDLYPAVGKRSLLFMMSQ